MATKAIDLVVDALGRVQETVHEVVEGLDEAALTYRLDDRANTIAWLVWHLTRVEDDHIAAVVGADQVWHDAGWFDSFGLRLDPHDIGYGHTSEQVASVTADARQLAGYHDDVHDRVVELLRSVPDADLDRIVDRRWDPPVTMAVRLVSVVNDCTQHVGQAAFVRGILDRR